MFDMHAIKAKVKFMDLPKVEKGLLLAAIEVYIGTENKVNLPLSSLFDVMSNIELMYCYYLDMPTRTSQQVMSKLFVISTLETYQLSTRDDQSIVWDDVKYIADIGKAKILINKIDLQSYKK